MLLFCSVSASSHLSLSTFVYTWPWQGGVIKVVAQVLAFTGLAEVCNARLRCRSLHLISSISAFLRLSLLTFVPLALTRWSDKSSSTGTGVHRTCRSV